ncbi:MAG: CheR family methyltransferase [Acidobacteriota bacterium]
MKSLIETNHLAGSVYLLRDLIQDRVGLSLSDDNGVRLIVNKLTGRVKQGRCKSFLEYYHLLSSEGAAADEEWRQVVAVLAKSKSGFYRQTIAVRALVDVALPQLRSRSRTDIASPSAPLRIWSASCATGEEPLSIAMALNEAGWFERGPIEILASDASYVAIDRAIQGVYSEQRISGLDDQLRDKYFTQQEGGWRVVPEMHKLIQWRVANLMSENEVADLARSQVIFCRNVFIYFTEPAIYKTLRLFAGFMPAGAFLFSDSGDYFTSLVSSTDLFEPMNATGLDVWIRRDTGGV